MEDRPINIAIFASGSGTNAERIMHFFKEREGVNVKILLSNNSTAFALERAKRNKVPTYIFNKAEFAGSDKVIDILKENKVDWVILAGFLWLIPENLIRAYPGRIINIHPALLPKFGGKGMYGAKVHEAVIAAGETVSGITIHYINEKYDEGEVIFQATCTVEKDDTPDSLAGKIHKLEYEHFPEIIDRLIKENR